MNLTTAEDWALEMARALAMDSAHIPAIKSQLVPQYRQIQADALRFAASVIVDTGLPENEYSKDRIDYILDLLHNEANQLQPLPDDLTDSQKEIIRHFI